MVLGLPHAVSELIPLPRASRELPRFQPIFMLEVSSLAVTFLSKLPVVLPEGLLPAVTLTVTVAFFPEPSADFTVIVVLPLLMPLITPSLLTVATFLSEEEHVSDLFDAFEGNTFALIL